MKSNIKMHNELNDRQKKFSHIVNCISDQSMMQIWNATLEEFAKIGDLSGDEACSWFTTLISRMVAAFIQEMKSGIADHDVTCRSMDEIQNYIFEGVSAILGTKVLQKISNQNVCEIKRIGVPK
jgi:hypothetical protein